ncbi:hypothetical protein V5O48_017780 [Marasmius crinis-equi]|uniref:F-box domain-containing protein n=1 Tax=Marasmius crinis-equi TaxID=585013 RepID=A0ABR3EN56_9AGAR
MSGLRGKLKKRGIDIWEDPSLNDFFQCIPVELQSEIVKKMRYRDRVHFGRSSKYFQGLADPCTDILYNIDNFLAKFFDDDDILEFLRVQTRTQAIIGGSSGQEFFDHKEHVGPLKVYVVGWRSRRLAQFLPTTGYAAMEIQPPRKLKSISEVTIFTRVGRPDIHVHFTKFAILLPILEQTFSCLMAFMTSTQAIHLFPNSALQYREAVSNSNGREDDISDAITQRLKEDGYTFHDQPTYRERYQGLPEFEWNHVPPHFSEYRFRRRVGDNRTLVIELDENGLSGLGSHINAMETLLMRNSWKHDEEPGPIEFAQFPPVLEWSYVIGRYCQSKDILVQHEHSGHIGGNFCVEFEDLEEEEENLSLQSKSFCM